MKANKKALEIIFDKMAKDGIDLYGSHLWTFYFFSKKIIELEKLSEREEFNNAYSKIIDLMNDGFYRFLVEFNETHSVDSLHKKNLLYNCLAEENEIELYDGWDINV